MTLEFLFNISRHNYYGWVPMVFMDAWPFPIPKTLVDCEVTHVTPWAVYNEMSALFRLK